MAYARCSRSKSLDAPDRAAVTWSCRQTDAQNNRHRRAGIPLVRYLNCARCACNQSVGATDEAHAFCQAALCTYNHPNATRLKYACDVRSPAHETHLCSLNRLSGPPERKNARDFAHLAARRPSASTFSQSANIHRCAQGTRFVEDLRVRLYIATRVCSDPLTSLDRIKTLPQSPLLLALFFLLPPPTQLLRSTFPRSYLVFRSSMSDTKGLKRPGATSQDDSGRSFVCLVLAGLWLTSITRVTR